MRRIATGAIVRSYTPVLAGILTLLYSSQLGDMQSEPQLTRYLWHNFTVKTVGTDGETPAAFLLNWKLCMIIGLNMQAGPQQLESDVKVRPSSASSVTSHPPSTSLQSALTKPISLEIDKRR
jgi:hypothetical protein